MKYIATLILLLLLTPALIQASEQDHYCDDQASWQQWEKLLTDNPTDDGIASLYAFRIGLCSMVKSGQIETTRATKLFEGMRDAVLNGIDASEKASKMNGDEGI